MQLRFAAFGLFGLASSFTIACQLEDDRPRPGAFGGRDDDEDAGSEDGLGGQAGAGPGANPGGEACRDVECPDGKVCYTDGDDTYCDCPEGRTGDHCAENVNECALGESACAAEASCTDLDGGYLCSCDTGTEGDGESCADVDECALGTDGCAAGAECENGPGGYDCTCTGGAVGDGFFCHAEDPCEGVDCGSGDCHAIPAGSRCDCPLGNTGSACAVDCSDVDLADPELDALVREALAQPVGAIDARSTSLTSLGAVPFAAEPITALDGLSCFVELESIALRAQAVSDIGELGALGALSTLDLGCNPLEDVAALSSLYELRSLALDALGCEPPAGELDLGPLAKLPRLGTLDLSGRSLGSLLPLGALGSLESLALSGTSARDWAALGALSALRHLSVSRSNLPDLAALAELGELRSLDLSGTELALTSGIAELDQLEMLRLSDNGYEAMQGAKVPVTVRSLDLSYNQLTVAPELGHLVVLADLNLWGNELTSLAGLAELAWVPGASLYIGQNPLECGAALEEVALLEARGVLVFHDCDAGP